MSVYINAFGMATPLGSGKRVNADNLFAGRQVGFTDSGDLIPNRTVQIGAVAGSLPDIPARLRRFDCRNNRLALAALAEIEADIDAAIRSFGADRIGVVLGTSTAGMADGEAAYAQRRDTGNWPASFAYSRQEPGNLAAFVADYFALGGPAYTVTTACSSSGKVFASAERLLATGICDAVLAGGVDTICKLTLNGFNALEALTKGICLPFSRHRDGINIGEGAAIALLSRRPDTVALLGVGESSDAHHPSAPDPTGRGALAAMQAALEHARLDPDSIAYINLHGTATPLNDAMEGRAVAALFGERVPCSSTKALTGHMLGAAGACEIGFLYLALDPDYADDRLPPHIWDGAADPEIPALDFVERGRKRPSTRRQAMLSNSFGFGGSNAALILGTGYGG